MFVHCQIVFFQAKLHTNLCNQNHYIVTCQIIQSKIYLSKDSSLPRQNLKRILSKLNVIQACAMNFALVAGLNELHSPPTSKVFDLLILSRRMMTVMKTMTMMMTLERSLIIDLIQDKEDNDIDDDDDDKIKL